MYLIFSTSALGSPKKWNAAATDSFNWPRILRLSWIVLNEDCKPIAQKDYIIKPEGFEIPIEQERITGINYDEAKKEGHDLSLVLRKFGDAIKEAKYMFSFNLRLHENIVAAEYFRKGIQHALLSSEKYCLMMETTYLCKIPGRDGKFKWPSLSELYGLLFNKKLIKAKNAKIATNATAVCFVKLLKTGNLDDIF